MLVPTYEYECEKCRRVFEVRQRISEPALTTCDQCGGAVRRLLSAAPFILKGEGWYVTDYPSEARKKAREAEKSTVGTADKSARSSDTAAAGKTDSAPKPESKATENSSTSAPSAKTDVK